MFPQYFLTYCVNFCGEYLCLVYQWEWTKVKKILGKKEITCCVEQQLLKIKRTLERISRVSATIVNGEL